jgi:O-acetyl-ADP-ribose deacetylase (regulator of RNase III)
MYTIDYYLRKRDRSTNTNTSSLSDKENSARKNQIADSYRIEWRNGINLNLRRDDLTEQETNVIVNAANNELRLGGGVAGAIRNKGGYKIQEECTKKLNLRGSYFENGDVVPTGIGDFKNKNLNYIFHAVGPVYYNGKQNEAEELKRTFLNCFKLSEKLNVESISIPPISSGIFGYPKAECAEIFYRCLEIYVRHKIKSGTPIVLKEIRMTIIDMETYSVFVEIHNKKILEYKNSFGGDIYMIYPDFANDNEEKNVEEHSESNMGEVEAKNVKTLEHGIHVRKDRMQLGLGEKKIQHEQEVVITEEKRIFKYDNEEIKNDNLDENKVIYDNESIIQKEDFKTIILNEDENENNYFFIELKEEVSETNEPITNEQVVIHNKTESKDCHPVDTNTNPQDKSIPSSFDLTSSSQINSLYILDEISESDKDDKVENDLTE